MKMKALTISSIVTVFAAMPALAEGNFVDGGNWYLEGEDIYTAVSEDVNGTEYEYGYSALAVVGGYELSNGLAFEVVLGHGYGNDDVTVLGNTLEAELGGIYGVALKYSFDLSEAARLYGKLRYTAATADFTYMGNTWSSDADEIGFGVGGSYAFTDKVYGFLEYARLFEISDSVAVGIGFKF